MQGAALVRSRTPGFRFAVRVRLYFLRKPELGLALPLRGEWSRSSAA